jgi:hypothetical protein
LYITIDIFRGVLEGGWERNRPRVHNIVVANKNVVKAAVADRHEEKNKMKARIT